MAHRLYELDVRLRSIEPPIDAGRTPRAALVR